MSGTNWDKELAKIDRQLASVSDEQLVQAPRAPAPAPKNGVVAPRQRRAMLGVAARLALAVVLSVAMLFWPYDARCGTGLLAYLGAVAAVVGAGLWTTFWSWRLRAPKAHALSLLVVLWGLGLGAREVLPRVGYAMPSVAHPATWLCE